MPSRQGFSLISPRRDEYRMESSSNLVFGSSSASILISSLKAMPSDSSFIRSDRAAEDHAALRVAHQRKNSGTWQRKHKVAELVFEAHGAVVARGKAWGVEEVNLEMEEGFEQVADGVGRVAVVVEVTMTSPVATPSRVCRRVRNRARPRG